MKIAETAIKSSLASSTKTARQGYGDLYKYLQAA